MKLYGADVFLVLLAAAVLLHFNLTEYNFGVVEKGKIYRSAQPDKEFLEKLFAEYHIKTIIVLKSGVPDFEQEFATQHDIIIYHLPLNMRREPPEETVNKFLEIVQNPENYPILVHCRAGADRTGLMIALKRIIVDNWTLKQAKKEMRHYRFVPLFHPQFNKYLKKRYEALTKPNTP